MSGPNYATRETLEELYDQLADAYDKLETLRKAQRRNPVIRILLMNACDDVAEACAAVEAASVITGTYPMKIVTRDEPRARTTAR